METKIWYQVKPADFDTEQRLSEIKDLGVEGLYVDWEISQNQQAKAKKMGFELVYTDPALNCNITKAIKKHMIDHQMSAQELVTLLNQEKDGLKNNLTSILGQDLQSLYQELALIILVAQNPVIPNELLADDHSQDWDKVAALLELKAKNKDLFADRNLKITVTENGLIEVILSGNKTITAYFNTSLDALGFNSQADVIQNYLVGQLLPKGIVIKVE
ncbi:hypothetical protein [uncultured Lactobacillus sp.]|uniref:hypothetical protein n=1 Tax=uncultured Lactobacillus sp. TaxID=153152 RepID=UPI00260C6DA3|nr:hypothetical protein [uncultured Lactobacillus sp.]